MNSTHISRQYCYFIKFEDWEDDKGTWTCRRCHRGFEHDEEAKAEVCCEGKRHLPLWFVSYSRDYDEYDIFRSTENSCYGSCEMFENLAEAQAYVLKRRQKDLKRIQDELEKLQGLVEDEVRWDKEPSALRQLAEAAE